MIPAQRVSTSHLDTDAAEVEAEVQEKRAILERAIEDNFEHLLMVVARLLRRMNVSERSGSRTQGDIAGDVLSDACCAVLRQAEKFEAGRDPVPWVLGYVANRAKRERESVFALNRSSSERPEVCACDLAADDQSADDALEAHAANLALALGLLHSRRATALETSQSLAALLEPLGESDLAVVALSVFEGYDSARLGLALGTSAPTARKRLQRALDRLRSHIGRSPSSFDWIENLPALLELRGVGATALSAPPCHSGGGARQHLRDGAPAANARPTRSSHMNSTSAPQAAQNQGFASAHARAHDCSPASAMRVEVGYRGGR